MEGGADTYKKGSLVRRLKPVRLVNFLTSGDIQSGTITRKLLIQGLSSSVIVHIACAIEGPQGQPVVPSDYPTTPGTMQLIPIVNPPEGNRIWLREVFQDPTLTPTDNADHPLPQNLPFGWSFSPEGADEVEINVSLDASQYVGSDIQGCLIVTVTVEYVGTWMDPIAFNYNISRPRIIGDVDESPTINTGGE